MKDKGTLADLERLKDEYREEFKAKAPKIKKIDKWCFRLRCPTVVNPERFKYSGGRLHLDKRTCTNKRCRREMLEEYKRMATLTLSWRQGEYPGTAEMWRNVIKAQKEKLQRVKGWPKREE